ncbi:molybdenum cofactor biosynthesis prote [Exidia glandulosa HHB12029]|uniref:cyclic pyranopterin monophosphate synthase n=1 Tax=Exidia glandulosa HHB12029 TaxID=1314781 RepID=A0A165ND89_EXIGL|nr:molybdenum cofactor biosynthesis prote [Exidia glandulosa HHB12029]
MIARAENDRPQVLIDTFNRKHDYLRISLTERCNLRCFYCMPEEGVELSPRAHILSDDEIIRLATLFVKNGVTKIRLTGGEPTVRSSLSSIIQRLGDLRPLGLKTVAMTSNGISLHRRLPDLAANGLTHLNLRQASPQTFLDTLDPLKFELMTRRPAAGQAHVLSSLDTALGLPLLQGVKLNAVVIRGLNDDEVGAFVELTRTRAITVRFIEYMPFSGNKWNKNKMVPSAELLARIQTLYPTIEKNTDGEHDTSRSWRVPGYKGAVGFISSMSDHFCGTCNRLRLTADGQIKVCLFDAKEVSLRDMLRSGASDEQLLEVIRVALAGKKAKHAGMDLIDVVHNRPMILIGVPASARPRLGFRVAKSMGSGTYMLATLPPSATSTPSLARMYSTTRSDDDDKSEHRLTHMTPDGRPHMVDISHKATTTRAATARGHIRLPPHAFALLSQPQPNPGAFAKGDPLAVAQLAAIMAAKRTAELIPLCHPALPVTHVDVSLTPVPETSSVVCEATVRCVGRTGVEMEALTAVSVGLLTVWDMVKAVAGREMVIEDVKVVRKEGGKSGAWALEE